MDKVRAARDEPAYLRARQRFSRTVFRQLRKPLFSPRPIRASCPRSRRCALIFAIRPDHTRMSYEEHKQILHAIQRKWDKELIPNSRQAH